MNFSTPGLITPTKKTNSLRNACGSLLMLIALIFVGQMSFAQTTYTWNSSTAVWTTTTAWTPTRTSPAVNDILVFSSGTTVTPTSVPTQTIGQLSISGNTIVNLQAGTAANVLTIGAGIAGADLSVASGSQLNVNGANAMNINIATGNTASITGAMTFSVAVNTFTAADASGITFNSGAVFTQATGNTGTVFGGSGTANTVVFASGSTFIQNVGSSPFALTQPATKVVFQSGSLFKFQIASGTPAFSGRTYGNFENNATGTISPSGSSAVSIENLTITQGTFNFGVTGTPGHSIKGNISVASGATLNFNGASATTINFNGTTAQTITNAGTLTFAANDAIVIANTASPTPSVTINQATTIAGAITINSGSILAIGGGTLTPSGGVTVNGSFQINPSGFASGGTFTYNAGSTLIYNTTSNFGENGSAFFPTLNGPPNLTNSGAGGMTLNVARTISGTCLVANGGISNANNLTLNGTAQINSGGFFSGSPTYGASSTLVYNNGAAFGNGSEWTGGGSTTPAAGSGVPANVTVQNSGTNVTLGGARGVPGNVTISSGAVLTLNATSGDLFIAGNFAQNGGSGGLINNTRAVQFVNSAATQTISATGGTVFFDYFLINKPSGTVQLSSAIPTDITINTTVSNFLQILNAGTLDLNGRSITLNNNGGLIFVNGAARTITSSVSGGTIVLNGSKTVANNAGTGALVLGANVTVQLNANGIIDFGNSGGQITTLNGTLLLTSNTNSFVNTNPPIYGAAAILSYTASAYTSSTEWPSSNGPANVNVSSSTSLVLGASRTLTGTLSLNNGLLTTNANVITVTSAGNITRNTGFIIGNLQRGIATGTNTYAYPVGTASGYTPASIAFSGTTGAGNVTVVSINGASSNYPAVFSATKRVARYWTVTNSGVSGFTAAATFTYLGADLVGGATQSSVKPYKFDAPSTFSYPSSSTGTLSFTETGITSFSEFGAGECGTVTVAPITGGGASLCIGATQQLASTTPGGVWTSDAPSIASVSVGGLVTANLNGTTTIHYTVTDISGCTGEATQSVTVLPNYTITASAGAGGSISPNGVTTLCSGNNQTYTITAADACHVISDVVVDGVSQGAVGTFTFTNVTANHTISASFSLITYTITVTAGANGSITPATGSVNCGSNATYTITPNACYSISDVVVDGVSQGAVGTFTFTNVTANHTISATFVLNTYTITVTAGANGSITPATGSVNCGDNATYTITANACYSIADVIVDGVSQGAVGTFTFTNVTANHTISATFVLNTYTITVTAGANGSITPATGSVNCGDNATYTITPNACYSIADVIVDGVSQGAVGTFTFTNVTTNHTISATFVLSTYTITVTAGANGSITPATGSVNCGDNATYTITANGCYSIADVIVDGVSQGAVGTFTFTNVTANHTISATFVLNTYTITVTAGANGSITPATGSVNCGDNATYTITPDACFAIADVIVDGVSQGAVGTFTFTNVTANHTISATFVATTYTITVTAGANGSITPATGSVNCGDNATYTITANACYSIADVIVDGVSQGAVGTHTFTNVTANHTISATFVLNTYTITVTAGANGSITPATGSVNCGDNATYTITADACYSIADVIVDGVSQGAVGTFTFTNVTANHTISATFVLNTYTITVTAGANGSITPATGSVNCGDNATYTITANACYSIADVIVDGVSQGAVGTFTFTNVTANHTISATFVLNTYTITVTAGANGSITPATGSVNCGDNATYTITADACFAIADVIVDGVSQGAVGTFTFTNVTANHTISATFIATTYTITVTAGANGSITPATGSVNCGDNATYTITADACYSIADVIVDGVSQGAVGTHTFTNVTANHSISATFVLNTYTITVTAGANGSITPATGSVNCGDNATYTITPNACYSIADVIIDGVSQGAVGTHTFTNVTANHTISATFVLNTYTITVTAGANGSITPATGSVNCGDNATYTITPDACYSIADVIVDGVSQGAVGTHTFTNVTANHTISATFVLNTYTITVTAGANGSITPATGSVNCGDNATYTITANACYAIADVIVDGVSQGAVGTYTFTNVTANHTISATFVLNTYTITVTAGANGSITPATGSVNCGDNATYTITPNACYSIADVIVDGVSQGAVGTFTFTNVTANHTISATFVLNTYTITVTAGANGSITPATGSVNCGDNATYTITANACYSIADVIVDGVSQGAVGTFTFTNVTANHTISATFVLNTYTITVTAGANGSITPATGSVNCGDNATYTITPNACYSIADVIVDGVSQGAVGTFTFTNVTANHTISATFVLNTYTITVTAGANGSITPATGSVNCGDNATYTITANACYAIADVIVDGVSQGAVGTYTFTNVTANHTISATFALTNYTITVIAGANGSITPGTGSVNCGANATYTITANACYSIANVIVDGVSQGAVGTFTFTNVTANHTISATFSLNTFAITVTAGANGTITPGTGSVNCGSNATYTITANACYHINDVVVDGVSQGAVGTYTFTNVTATHTISASFVANNPLTAPVVTGPVNVCPYIGSATQLTYTVPAVPGATSYNWTVPTSVTIVSGQGTPSLVVTIGNTFQATPNKQIRISVATTCGTTPLTVYVLVAQAPGTPQPITGPTSVCPIIGTPATFTYTIAPVLNATSYIWAAQAGTTTITHPNGPGANDTIVNVSFTNGFTSSNITVRAANDSCGASNVRSLPLTKANPSAPGLIAGSTNACPYMAPGGIPATYSVAAVVGQTYTWTVPAGAIGLTGQGTNAISFTYPASFVSGTISVTTTNGCGTSAARTLSINKLLPATPGVIDVIQTQPCPNRIYTYTISATPASSTSVQWTVPVGATLVSGQGSNSITVSYPGTAFNSNVTAQSFNNCGSSTIRSTPVHLPTCVEEKQTNTFTKGGTTTTPAAETMKVNVYPNPTVSDFKLQVVTAGKQTINVRIADAQGRSIKTFEVMPYNTINVGSELKAGAYMMEVRQGNEVKVTKLLKF